MKLLAVVPARGGSKGIPRKNLVPVAGRPLIGWTLLAATAAGCLERIAVSTDDDEIASVARAYGAEIIERPAALAGDAVPTRPVLVHACDTLMVGDGYRPDAVVTLQPTSPLRLAADIEAAAAVFAADPTADSLVSVAPVPHHFHPLSVMRRLSDGSLAPFIDQDITPTRRQDKPAVFARNGAAVYITRTDRLDQYVFGGRLLAYEMPLERSLDIDGPDDLRLAEAALKARPDHA